jgi:hypothetical protein
MQVRSSAIWISRASAGDVDRGHAVDLLQLRLDDVVGEHAPATKAPCNV